MPIHDWMKVPDSIFDAFHHRWISALTDVLIAGQLPPDYYALPEQIAMEFGLDVLALQNQVTEEGSTPGHKKSSIAIRHVSGDRIVAMLEIVSLGNKASRSAFRALVNKACELLEARIHLLIVDPFPPGPRDPNGVHAAIWEEVEDTAFQLPDDKPLTLVSYECDLTTRAYIEPIAVGDALPDMPLFLEPNGYIAVPLESTYQAAYEVMPRRWRDELQPSGD